MNDLIERDKAIAVIDRCKHRLQGQGSTYEFMLDMMKAIPSADVPMTATEIIDAIHEAEYRGYMKGVLVGGEERPKGEWTSVLAELHEQFSVLEKEIRKASAEMSAIIRANLDRPKGERIAIGAVCEVICKHCIKANGYCQHHWKCPLLTEIAKLIEPKTEPQTEREGE